MLKRTSSLQYKLWQVNLGSGLRGARGLLPILELGPDN